MGTQYNGELLPYMEIPNGQREVTDSYTFLKIFNYNFLMCKLLSNVIFTINVCDKIQMLSTSSS